MKYRYIFVMFKQSVSFDVLVSYLVSNIITPLACLVTLCSLKSGQRVVFQGHIFSIQVTELSFQNSLMAFQFA